MRILAQVLRPHTYSTPAIAVYLRRILRITLPIVGVYAIWRGLEIGKAAAAAEKIAFEEYCRQLDRETAEDMRLTHERSARMDSALDKILSYAGLGPTEN